MTRRLAALLGLLVLPAAASAQTQEVDRVVAVVGNGVVLWSQVIIELSQQGVNVSQLPNTPEGRAVVDQAVNDLIDDDVLVQEAIRDTAVHVTDEEVAQAVDGQLSALRRRFPTELQFRQEVKRSGFDTPEDYRRWYSEQQRRFFLRQRYVERLTQARKLQPVQPTEQELRDGFQQMVGSLPPEARQRPALVTLRQIVVTPKPSADSKALARAKADSIVRELRNGADFAQAARRFSQDPGSRERGGDLGWFRRGEMVPEFDREAFRQRPGVISDPVESQYGFHIIQVTRVQPTEIAARHILIMPQLTQADADSAKALADRVLAAVQGGSSVDSLQFLYYSADYPKEMRDVPADSLASYGGALTTADSGAVVLVPLAGETPIQTRYVVVMVMGRKAAGEITFEDVREQVRTRLSHDLAIKRLAARLRARTYVEIRPYPM